jgi:hypothetical protein
MTDVNVPEANVPEENVPVPPAAGTRSLVTQASVAPPPLPSRHSTLPNWTVLLLGVALALAAANPASLASRGPAGWLLLLAAVATAVWAAPAVVQRPASAAVQWTSRLIRHRNTMFAVACTALAAFSDPAVWLTVVDAALLLAYLLAVDALAAGPIGVSQLRRGTAPLTAAAASAIALLGAQAPVDSGAVWGRVVAALAVAAAASAAAAALWLRQTRGQTSLRDEFVDVLRRRDRNKPRHL